MGSPFGWLTAMSIATKRAFLFTHLLFDKFLHIYTKYLCKYIENIWLIVYLFIFLRKKNVYLYINGRRTTENQHKNFYI